MHMIHALDRNIKLLYVGVNWLYDYESFYGTPNKARESNEFDKCDTGSNGLVYIKTNSQFIFPVLKYGSDIEEQISQEINWHMNYRSDFEEFKGEMNLGNIIVDFDTTENTVIGYK